MYVRIGYAGISLEDKHEFCVQSHRKLQLSCRPLVSVSDALLLMGLFDPQDTKQLLSILDPKTFGAQPSSSSKFISASKDASSL